MTVLVDTSIWSLVYRRRRPASAEQPLVDEFIRLVRGHHAVMIGPVRQEVLTGIRDARAWEILRTTLRAFEDLPIASDDFEHAAELFNRCRSAGVQGSSVDFLICAVSQRYEAPIFTTDHDFLSYAKHLGISLHRPRQSS